MRELSNSPTLKFDLMSFFRIFYILSALSVKAFSLQTDISKKWRFADGPMMAHFKWYCNLLSPHQLIKKKVVRFGPPLSKLSGYAHDMHASVHCALS